MPRPTTAQVAYGSLTVVLSTFALLLLSGARSGAGVVVVAAAGLILGLLVAFALVLQNGRRPASAASAAPAVRVPRPRVTAGASENRVGEHSLRR
jgi:hypothetical protein